MPPSGCSERVVRNALKFVKDCYKNLLQKIRSGDDSSYEEAIETELAQIKKALYEVRIDDEGDLISKESVFLKQKPIIPGTGRFDRLARLRSFFLRTLVEDGIDGTDFDLDVLDTLEKLGKKYKKK